MAFGFAAVVSPASVADSAKCGDSKATVSRDRTGVEYVSPFPPSPGGSFRRISQRGAGYSTHGYRKINFHKCSMAPSHLHIFKVLQFEVFNIENVMSVCSKQKR